MKENLVVDCAYTSKEYPNNIIVEIKGEYYLLPTLNRKSNDLADFKKIPNNVIKAKNLTELPNYRYVTKDLEKRTGYNIPLGRAISDKEFEELKQDLNLSDEDVSEPFENVKGAIYGENSEKRYTCIQIRVNEFKAIEIERKLKAKGIETSSPNIGRVDIRVQE